MISKKLARFKRERIKRYIYRGRDEARQDVFDDDDTEMSYNSTRRHGDNDGLSPREHERRHDQRVTSV